MSNARGYDIGRAAAVSGLSRYMVDYLSRSGIVVPRIHKPGRGRRREYSFGDLVALRTAAVLLASGIEVKRLKRSLRELQAKYKRDLRDAPAAYFCTDGVGVYFRSAPGIYADLNRGSQMVFQFVVNLERVHAEIVKAVAVG